MMRSPRLPFAMRTRFCAATGPSCARISAGTTALVYYDFDVPSYDFCKRLYDETGAFVTPGDCFEQPKSMRVGYACDKKTLEDGLAALAKFAETLG